MEIVFSNTRETCQIDGKTCLIVSERVKRMEFSSSVALWGTIVEHEFTAMTDSFHTPYGYWKTPRKFRLVFDDNTRLTNPHYVEVKK